MLRVIVILCASISCCVAQELPLSTFLDLVERNHPSLRSAGYEPDLAQAEVRSALGRFDPVFSMNYDSKLKYGTEKVSTLNGELELPLDMLFGPKVKAAYNRGYGSAINPESLTSSAGEASLGVVLPVFQGIFTDYRRNSLRKAMLRPDFASAQLHIERNGLLRNAATRYWDWSESIEIVRITDSLVRLAENRLNFVRSRARAGETSVIDTVEAYQEVLRRRGESIRASRIEQQLSAEIAGFIWGDGTAVLQSFSACEPLPADRVGPPPRDTLTNSARSLRPEIRRARYFIEIAHLDSSLAQEYMRPFVELQAGLITYDVSAPSSTDYKFGLRVQQPLLFRQASAQVQTASIAVDRAELTLALVHRVVEVDVTTATVAVEKSIERLSIAEQEVEAARTMVQAEQNRFLAGDTSLLTLNLRERFYGEALLRLANAKAELAKARITLKWATGLI